MKKNILVTLCLVVVMVVGVFAVLNAPAVPTGVSMVSDSVTAPDPNWLTPEQQQRGINALQDLINQNK